MLTTVGRGETELQQDFAQRAVSRTDSVVSFNHDTWSNLFFVGGLACTMNTTLQVRALVHRQGQSWDLSSRDLSQNFGTDDLSPDFAGT